MTGIIEATKRAYYVFIGRCIDGEWHDYRVFTDDSTLFRYTVCKKCGKAYVD